MKKYRVIFYIDYLVEADNRDEALDEAESMLVKDFESSYCDLTEMFNSKVEEVENDLKKRR